MQFSGPLEGCVTGDLSGERTIRVRQKGILELQPAPPYQGAAGNGFATLGYCGFAFWAMMGPMAIKAFRATPLRMKTVGMALWYFSTLPLVLLSLVLWGMLIYYRITES